MGDSEQAGRSPPPEPPFSEERALHPLQPAKDVVIGACGKPSPQRHPHHYV